MLTISNIRKTAHTILCIGSHPGIIQSMLDFDYLAGKKEPSVVAILAAGRNSEKYFFGKREILLPVYHSLQAIPEEVKQHITLFLNLSSARRVLSSTQDVLEQLPNIQGGAIFAEDVPEKHSLDLYQITREKGVFIVGPASVGLLIPGVLKLGAVGGVDMRQLVDSHLFTSGSVAVFSASGGMTNELIRIVTQQGKRLSFALAFGGDRFPITSPEDALLAAEQDPDTDTICYFGELGGTDEYVIAQLLHEKKITKKVICYIAGVIADLFETPPQFGHAKAMAKDKQESAQEKRKILQEAGAIVPESFTAFVEEIKKLPTISYKEVDVTEKMQAIRSRKKALFSSSISGDKDGQAQILGIDLLTFAKSHSFAATVASLFLGREVQSKEVEDFIDFILRLLVDHGPYQSGAVNTMITARAGKDLPSALASGILTIGPRFGGAVNQAALNWLKGAESKKSVIEFVEDFARRKEYISGIGHKKYRIDFPDPRVEEILKFTDGLKEKKYVQFAQSVEKVTATKKGNLILNVDGAIAAVLLDLLSEKEGMNEQELQKLAEHEFFNALFIASRSIGFIAHYLDQKRLDEGLFRLSEDDVLGV